MLLKLLFIVAIFLAIYVVKSSAAPKKYNPISVTESADDYKIRDFMRERLSQNSMGYQASKVHGESLLVGSLVEKAAPSDEEVSGLKSAFLASRPPHWVRNEIALSTLSRYIEKIDSDIGPLFNLGVVQKAYTTKKSLLGNFMGTGSPVKTYDRVYRDLFFFSHKNQRYLSMKEPFIMSRIGRFESNKGDFQVLDVVQIEPLSYPGVILSQAIDVTPHQYSNRYLYFSLGPDSIYHRWSSDADG